MGGWGGVGVVTKNGPSWVCRRTTGGAEGRGWGARPPSAPVAPKHLPRPPNGPTNATTSLSLVNEHPAHPAELAGKPPPEGTKVFVMELLEFGGPADVA